MCQTSVLLEKNGGQELLLENVTSLEVKEDRLVIATLFEGARDYADVAIRSIDFSSGRVILYRPEH